MRGTGRILAVEDTYGVAFHRRLLEWLLGRGLICCRTGTPRRPTITTVPAKKCNPALVRKLIGLAIARAGPRGDWKILIVVDSEDKPPRQAAQESVLRHVEAHARKRSPGIASRFRVAVVIPSHEAWACIALGGGRKCRSKDGAKAHLERLLRRPYSKHLLERTPTMRDFNPQHLLGENDFKTYIEMLEWLLCNS